MQEEKQSADLIGLIEHQSQIREWIKAVNSRIYELEESYLEETNMGNIIRGFDQDGKLVNIRKGNQAEDKERLFSFSSYSMWLDSKLSKTSEHGYHLEEKKGTGVGFGSSSSAVAPSTAASTTASSSESGSANISGAAGGQIVGSTSSAISGAGIGAGKGDLLSFATATVAVEPPKKKKKKV